MDPFLENAHRALEEATRHLGPDDPADFGPENLPPEPANPPEPIGPRRDARPVPGTPDHIAPGEDPVKALLATPHGRHFASLVLSEVPEDALSHEEVPSIARILYAGSYIALWQFISQFRADLPIAHQDRIVARALAYIKHVETLKLAPLQLDPANSPADRSLVEQAARLRARLLRVSQTVRATVAIPDSPVGESEAPPGPPVSPGGGALSPGEGAVSLDGGFSSFEDPGPRGEDPYK